MALSPGDQLGPYVVTAPIGAGGMGEVYKARDTRLDRTVAIKVLPEHIAMRDDLRARFEREARAVASLNHPNICTLFDIGTQDGVGGFMVMELIEGESLAQRIEKGAIPLDQALQFATQIADALDRAHRAGVTHRDVKPQNIMLTRDGVKVLDFGLAKSQAKSRPAEETLTAVLTTEGTVMGTPQYMAPEQFEGKEADARSDIWAFGAVLYEMVTGQKAFQGKSYSSLVGAILSADPAPMAVKPFTPSWLERLVRRCLQKDPENRYFAMRDLVIDLKSPPAESALPAPSRSRLGWVAWAVAGALAAVAAAGWLLRPTPLADPSPAIVDLQPTERDTRLSSVSVSPDGESIVWQGRTTGGEKLYMRSLSTGATRAVTDEPGIVRAWSPDSRSFLYTAGGKLRRVDLAGGAAQVIGDGGGYGAAWGKNGILLGNSEGPLLRIPIAGGTPAPLFKLDQERGETSQRNPVLLPDGRLLYVSQGRNADSSGLYVTPLDGSQKSRRVHPRAGGYRYIHPGRLIVRHAEGVALVRVDLDGGTPPGEPVMLDPDMANLLTHAAASLDGKVIALLSGGRREPDLALLDRTGKKLAVISPGATALAAHPEFSPDGKRIAFEISQGAAEDVWVFDLARQATSRLTFASGRNRAAAWSASGDRVFYYSERSGKDSGIYEIGSNGVGTEKQVAAVPAHHMHASPDGKVLAFERTPNASGSDLWTVSLDSKGKLQALLTGQAFLHPRVSPDSRFLAYSSRETFRPEVYIQTMPPGGGKWQVSTAGGSEPKWRSDGRELYFLSGESVMAAAITPRGSGVEVGAITPLFRARRGSAAAGHFAVSPDGKLFALSLLNERAQDQPVRLLLNWKLP